MPLCTLVIVSKNMNTKLQKIMPYKIVPYKIVPYKTIEEVGMPTKFRDCDFQTDRMIRNHRSDIIVPGKGAKNCHIIDVTFTK